MSETVGRKRHVRCGGPRLPSPKCDSSDMNDVPGSTLAGLRKLVQASPGRRTRFHTLRHELVPPRAFLVDLPALALRRICGRPPPGPWISQSAVRFLSSTVATNWRIFEFGSGLSTAWYASHGGSVTSLESDSYWYRRLQPAIANCPNATIERMAARDFPARISAEADASYDLIVIDGSETGLSPDDGRIGCVRASASKVKRGGFMLLDNSDRPEYSSADDILAAWDRTRFPGFPSSPFTAIETTLYRRPG